jgi:hypothetical protein
MKVLPGVRKLLVNGIMVVLIHGHAYTHQAHTEKHFGKKVTAVCDDKKEDVRGHFKEYRLKVIICQKSWVF